jgi:hypothetical protein
MISSKSGIKLILGLGLAFSTFAVSAQTIGLTLTGSQEVPAVITSATAVAAITIGPDGSVSGTITTTGIEGTMAHIHEAAMGQNGPVIVPFVKTGDNIWSAPPGAKLTDAQFQSFKSGNLYLNVHSAVNKAGEIRAQLKPQ